MELMEKLMRARIKRRKERRDPTKEPNVVPIGRGVTPGVVAVHVVEVEAHLAQGTVSRPKIVLFLSYTNLGKYI
jgi:hypothetical protein